MKTASILTLGLFTALSTGFATAEEEAAAPPFVWSRATLDLVASGDAARGKEVAKKQGCKKCHGDTGVAEDDETPSIAGQTPSYFFKQLVNYRSGTREDKDMAKAAKKLNDQQMADLAAFYKSQAPEDKVGKEPPELVSKGDISRLLLPCAVCHGKQGEGIGFESPAIAGQKVDHFVETMTAFQAGDRENDHYGRMRFIASQLTEEEVKELAAYYSAPPSEEDEDEEKAEEEEKE
jgi:cytochrome c553